MFDLILINSQISVVHEVLQVGLYTSVHVQDFKRQQRQNRAVIDTQCYQNTRKQRRMIKFSFVHELLTKELHRRYIAEEKKSRLQRLSQICMRGFFQCSNYYLTIRNFNSWSVEESSEK